jgi:cytochrome P450
MTITRPPSPPQNWLLGSMPPKKEQDSLAYEQDLVRQYGDIIYLRILHMHIYFLSHPAHMHKVTVEYAHKFHKGPTYKNLLSRFLGNGLLTSDGDFWKRQRKLAQPAFHTGRIQNYADVMVQYTQQMLAEWSDGEERIINPDMMKLTLRIVAKTLFDSEIANESDKVWQSLTALLHLTDEALQSPLQTLFFSWLPNARSRKTAAATNMLNEIISDILEERRKDMAHDTGDLLSMLMQAQDTDGSQMNDQQLRDEMVTIVLAGHETTANALSWTWYLLSQYPEVEAKLHAELDSVLAGRLPTMQDLRQLPYTEMVLKESMRLYPPIPQVERQALEDVEIGGYTIPKGTTVVLSPHITHRDARWYEDPDTFKPERWMNDFERSLPKAAYMPFGGGARICIGNSFAMMEASLILATIASQYRLHLLNTEAIEMESVLTLRPKQDVRMRLEARTPQPATAQPTLTGEPV